MYRFRTKTSDDRHGEKRKNKIEDPGSQEFNR